MPQYVQHGADVVEFPDNMADADIAKALGASAPAAAGGAPEPTSGVARAYQSVAKPVTNLLGKILEPATRTLTGPLVDAQRLLNGEGFDQVARTGSLMGERPGVAAPVAEKVAEIAVPQTPLQAGMMVGTMGAAPAARAIPAVASLAKAHPALTRILGGTAGGATGGAVGDEGALRGAGEGAVGSTLGEGLGALLGRLRLAIPGGKRATNNADAARIGQTVGEIVPELAGARTPADIRGMVEGQGRAALGQAKEGTTRAIEQSLTGRQYGPGPGEIPTPGPLRGQTIYGPNQSIPPGPAPRRIDTATPPASVPSRGPDLRPGQRMADVSATLGGERTPVAAAATVDMYGGTSRVPVSPPTMGNAAETAAETMARLGGQAATPPVPLGPYAGVGGPSRAVASVGSESMPLRQANDALTSIGEGAFNQNILDRGAKKAADRRLYGAVARDMESGIATAGGPDAAGAFASGQTNYAQGTKMLDLFKRSGVMDGEGFLNVARIQRALNDPRLAAQLKSALGDEGFAQFTDAVFRGAPRGAVDRMTSGQGGALDALMQVLRGQNTGAAQYARIPIATVLPNLGSRYVGKNPLALPDTLRTILDLGAQRGLDQVAR